MRSEGVGKMLFFLRQLACYVLVLTMWCFQNNPLKNLPLWGILCDAGMVYLTKHESRADVLEIHAFEMKGEIFTR